MKHLFGALKFVVLALVCLLLEQHAGFLLAAQAENARPRLRLPTKSMVARPARAPRVAKNVLLIMPDLNAKKSESDDGDQEEDLNTSLKTMGGNIVDTIGEGSLTVWVVRFDSQEHFLGAERKLVNDKRVKSLQRDYFYRTNDVSSTSSLAAITPNDPFFSSEWYFDALNVLPAWQLSRGGTNIIGVLDSGTNSDITDLKTKTLSGYDATAEKAGQTDVHGHGTMVATTAAAIANNNTGTAGPATRSVIYPVRVGFANGEVSVSAILKGIKLCGNHSIKIINLSSNGDPPFTFAHKNYNRVLHQYLEWYHDERGGLVFNAAGNSGTRDESLLRPYLIVVSALDEDYTLANFSTYGRPVWFTAPGRNIYCTEKSGQVVSVAGTSFSSPLCASVAALIWGAKPQMTNVEVERIMIATVQKAGEKAWTRWFGFGMPDAGAAMKMTLGK